MKERTLYLAIRDCLLGLVDAFERFLDLEPRTAQIRKWWKDKGAG